MEAIVEKLDYEGRGIIRDSNKVVFLPRTLPNENVSYHFGKNEKRYDIGVLDEIHTKSPHRVISFCPYSESCGGCTFDIVSYEKSLEFKKEIFLDYAKHNGVLLNDISIVESRPVLGYRNKVSLKVSSGKIGYYASESHFFVPIRNCFLATNAIQKVIKDFSLFAFHEGSLVIRSNSLDEVLLEIVTEEEIKIKEELVLNHKISGILWNQKCVYGKPYFMEDRNGIQYKIPYNAFFQVNKDISEKIKQDVFNYLSITDNVLDLYCGVGFFTLPVARIVSFVTGIEENKNAILGAMENASLNHIENVSFHVGKVENILDKIPFSYNKVIVDPPRAGLKKTVIDVLLKSKVENILYVSCNFFTLIRDIKLLEAKYKIKTVKLYDMFPYTKHVECVCVLNRL